MPPRKKAMLKVTTAPKRKRIVRQHETSSDENEAVASDKEADKEADQEKEATASKTPEEAASNEPASAVSKRAKRKALTLSEEQEVDLGEWMRNNPEIYNKTLKAYKDAPKKQKLWDDKAKLLDMEPDLLRVWYESIRTKVGKLSSTKSGSGAKEQTPRDKFIMSNFNFLKEHIARMKGRTGMSLAPHIELSKTSASQNTSSQQPTSQHESGDSDAELEESLQYQAPGSPLGPSSPDVLDDDDVPFMTKKGKGKGKSKTITITRPVHRSDDEGDDIMRQLRLSKKDSGEMKKQIATMLEGEALTTMTQFGRFISGLGSKIDERLVCQYYKDMLDVTVTAIRRSQSLPPPPRPRAPLPQGAGQQPQHQQPRQPQQFQQQQQPQQYHQQPQQFQQQQLQTYTAMLGTSQQDPGARSTPTSSTWDTYQPAAGANTAQLVVPNTTPTPVVATRPWSTPTFSVSSMPQLSDLSQSLMTPEDPSTHPHSPGATTNMPGGSFSGPGGSFSL